MIRPQTAPETGWLIESNHIDGTPHWFRLDDSEDVHTWTKDSTEALRFARKRDADAYVADIGWTNVTVTEHRWG